MKLKKLLKGCLNTVDSVCILEINTDDNLITHACYYTKTIIKKYGHYKIKQFLVGNNECDYYFIFIV